MRGITRGATAGAAVAFVVAWLLPWMGGVAAFPLLGHAFDMWFIFSFYAPGPGTGLEIVLMGLLGLVAIASSFLSAPRTAAVTAVLGGALGVHLMVRTHPGLDSGPGPLVAAAALTVIAVAQAFRGEAGKTWWSMGAGALVAALLAAATGFGAAAYASARDVDATTSDSTSATTVDEHAGELNGITARDNATGAERWHYWARDWTDPSVKLSGDGRTAFVIVQRVDEQEALAFDAHSGKPRWQRVLSPLGWPGPPPGPADDFFPLGQGLLLPIGTDQFRYFDADGNDSTIRLDKDCGISAVGGVRTLYVVEQYVGQLQLFAAGRDGERRWTTPAIHLPAHHEVVVADKGDTVVVTTGGSSETFDASTGNPLR